MAEFPTSKLDTKREGLRRTGKEGFFWRDSEATLMLLDRALDVAEENDWERAVCASQQKIASQGLLLGVEQACCGQDRAARM